MEVIYVLFFNNRKALDSFPHHPLVVKLRFHGLYDCIINWIKNHLAEWTEVVAVGGIESGSLPVLSGVPQGFSCFWTITLPTLH